MSLKAASVIRSSSTAVRAAALIVRSRLTDRGAADMAEALHAGGLLPSLAVDEEGALALDTDEDQLTFRAARESASSSAEGRLEGDARGATGGTSTEDEEGAWRTVLADLLPLTGAAIAASAVVPGCVNRSALTKGVLHQDLGVVGAQLEQLLALLGRLASLRRHVAMRAEAILSQVLRQGAGGAVAGAAVGEETAWFVDEACQRALAPVVAVVGPRFPDFQAVLSVRARVRWAVDGEDAPSEQVSNGGAAAEPMAAAEIVSRVTARAKAK